ncbi:MAG: hypothetical protein C0391_06415 [Anaerolinea sp.]|nr:hypothetical protein [Anaerolinea sp.]
METPDSSTLFLITCSNNKNEDIGNNRYAIRSSIINSVDSSSGKRLMAGRKHCYRIIKNSSSMRNGILLRDFGFNHRLNKGLDLGYENLTGVDYLPAIERYTGRFYASISPNIEFHHHVLIVSSLYGLLVPEEYIQIYSLHVTDDDNVSKSWSHNDRLTDILINYIQKNNLTHIIDFIADENYKNLISWEMVRNQVNGNVLHSYSKQYAGPEMLPLLGHIFSEIIRWPNEQLKGIKSGFQYKGIVFDKSQKIMNPFFPKQETNTAPNRLEDIIGRMRRNIYKIMNKAVLNSKLRSIILSEEYNIHFGNLIGYFKKINSETHKIGELIDDFSNLRNDVEYGKLNISNSPDTWKKICDDYSTLIKWARENYVDVGGFEKTGFE